MSILISGINLPKFFIDPEDKFSIDIKGKFSFRNNKWIFTFDGFVKPTEYSANNISEKTGNHLLNRSPLPKSVIVNGVEFPIRDQGSSRILLECVRVLSDESKIESKNARLETALSVFYSNIASHIQAKEMMKNEKLVEEAIKQMYEWIEKATLYYLGE